LDVTLVDENDNPVSNHIVALGFGTDSIACYYSYTNDDGFTSGKVPADETLILQIRGLCGEIIYSTTIGPFSEDTSLGNITIDDSNVNNTEITGTLVDCNGNLVTNGGVIVEVGDLEYITQVDNGTFNFFISTCDGATDLSVIGLDFDALLESDPVVGMVGTVVNTGAIEVCDNPITESILTITIDGITYNYFGDGLRGNINTNNISVTYTPVDSTGQETFISLVANGITAGNYDDNNNCFMYDFQAPFDLQGQNPNLGLIFTTFNITEITPDIVGSFSGEAVNVVGIVADTVDVSGNFTIIQ